MSNIFQFLPEHFLTEEGTVLRAILDGIGQSQDQIGDLTAAAIDQQFLATATGKYLLYLAEQSGFSLPSNSGLDIRALRALVPIAVASPKQVVDTINRLIEVFYGAERTRANILAESVAPYSFVDGDDLIVETESGRVQVGLDASLFSDITLVSAQELAAYLNVQQSVYLAEAYLNPETNDHQLRLLSKTSGVSSTIRVAGGTAQNILKLPKVVPITADAGTGWQVTKDQIYTDVTKIQWSGVGVDPQLYLLKPMDIVTIRGLSGPEADINGTYSVVDAGYDYFVIRNTAFQLVTYSFLQSDASNFVFTRGVQNTIYDSPEYALAVETGEKTVSVIVPATPPITRRFLAGSSHLHGQELPVTDFTRSGITVDITSADVSPNGANSLVLANQRRRPSLQKGNIFKTSAADDGNPRVYFLDYQDGYGALPYTAAEPVGIDVIYGDIGSREVFVEFPYPHGLQYRWGVTLQASSGAGNISSGVLSQEYPVAAVIDPYTVKLELPVSFSGISFGTFDVVQHNQIRKDGSDFYLQFSAAPSSLGIEQDQSLVIDPSSGTSLSVFLGPLVAGRRVAALTVDDAAMRVYVRMGLGRGNAGTVRSGASGMRSGRFGGSVSYFLDKSSSLNIAEVMSNLRATFLEYTPSSNPNYVGSFIFDPTGTSYQHTVSSHIVENAEEILRGANPLGIFVTSLNGFPKSGHLIIDHGTSKAEGPIRYLSTIQNDSGNSQILIDPAYRFKKTHDAGAKVWAVSALAPYQPDTKGTDRPVYVTGTTAARNTLLEMLRDIVASGIFIDFNVLYPKLKYSDPAIEPFA